MEKVSDIQIITSLDLNGKMYYQIKYIDINDGNMHIGYGSYVLDYVLGWTKECFEFVPKEEVERLIKNKKEKEEENAN
jgi:hypothetical protein